MFDGSCLRNLQIITPQNIQRLTSHSLGIFQGELDIIVCLDRWLILDFLQERWMIVDLKSGRIIGSLVPIDRTSPRSWVEITSEGLIHFYWSEQGSMGHKDYDLNSGTWKGSFMGYGGMGSVEFINGVAFANPNRYLKMSQVKSHSPICAGLPLANEDLVNTAFNDSLLITLDKSKSEVSVWYFEIPDSQQ